MKAVILSLVVLFATASIAGEHNMVWPPLSEFNAVTGRAATAEDVAAGSAVFVMQDDSGQPIGNAINIAVPQYGAHIDPDSGLSEPCVIIQAEEARGQRLIGAYTLPDRKLYAGLFNDFQLFGTHVPTVGAK